MKENSESDHESLFDLGEICAGEYDENNFEEAKLFLRGIKSDMGKTNILHPLKKILLPQTATPKHKRQVFLFTAGAIANESMVISTGNWFNLIN